MPIRVTKTGTVGRIYESPFVGPVNHTVGVLVDVSTLTNKEVDADGYLKPGVPLTRAGILVGAAPAFVYGVTVEEVKVADGNTALASVTLDVEVAVATIAMVNRDVIEDILDRALTANELAGFDAAGSRVVIIL